MPTIGQARNDLAGSLHVAAVDGADRLLSTAQVVEHLRAAGYDLRLSYVDYLLRQGYVAAPQTIGSGRAWTPADVARLTSELTRRGRGPGARR